MSTIALLTGEKLSFFLCAGFYRRFQTVNLQFSVSVFCRREGSVIHSASNLPVCTVKTMLIIRRLNLRAAMGAAVSDTVLSALTAVAIYHRRANAERSLSFIAVGVITLVCCALNASANASQLPARRITKSDQIWWNVGSPAERTGVRQTFRNFDVPAASST